MKGRKGFTLVELMVVVAIIAILAAVALPLYSTFKQKSKASTALKGAMGATQALQVFYSETFSFSSVTLSNATGGALLGTKGGNSIRVGTGLPGVPNLTWSVGPGSSRITISWVFSDGCRGTDCDGHLCLDCFANSDRCEITTVITNSNFGLNEGSASCP